MGKFRKKPVVIEAMLYDPNTLVVDEFLAWLECQWRQDSDGIAIITLEGEMKANQGDWIIKGIAGEFYPCKPDIFEATYESVG